MIGHSLPCSELKYRRAHLLESNCGNRCLIGLVISSGNGNELHLKAFCTTCGLFTMTESLRGKQCVKWFQIHQCFWGIIKLMAPTQVWRLNVPNGSGDGRGGCHFIRYMYVRMNSD